MKEANMEHDQASIVIIGPEGCGKTLNAPALAQALNRPHWCELDQYRRLPRKDHVILTTKLTSATTGLKVMTFSEAIKLVDKPRPETPR
jgi:hypothetical protein